MDGLIPKVAAIHDLAGFGRCSLSVVIPVLSSMGIQVCPMPTAVLSTHTGGFEGYTFVKLTDTLTAYYQHWKRLGIRFDCIYSGFLGSKAQIDILCAMIDAFQTPENLIVVDPAFADGGALYATFDAAFVAHMRRLVAKAQVITPNITEAAFLLGREMPAHLDAAQARDWLLALAALGPDTVIITSAPMQNSKSSVIAYEKNTQQFRQLPCEYVPAEYPGTGDIFTSVLTGALLQKNDVSMAITRAVDFVSTAIRATYDAGSEARNGVLLEKFLHTLADMPDKAACVDL